MPSARRVNANLSTNIATDVGVPKRAPIELAAQFLKIITLA